MNKKQFEAEKNYFSARSIAISLLNRELLTAEEFSQIDTILRDKYRPLFGKILADYPCYLSDSMA